MHPSENNVIFSLASIYVLRLFGLFMVLPVFALYAQNLIGTTPMLVGLAAGIYGLTQAMFQIPFGILSDYFGRKPIILIGLVTFILGSMIAAMSSSILFMIMGRALQGIGAIGSVLLALITDLTREENRTKAMAMIGLSIGITFSLGIILGPIFNAWLQVSGIFWLTAGFGLISIMIFLFWVPQPQKNSSIKAMHPLTQCVRVFKNKELLLLNFSIMILHAILSACFLVIPIILQHEFHFSAMQQCYLFLLVLISSFVAMLPFIYFAEKKHHIKSIFLSTIILLAFSQIMMWYGLYSSVWLTCALFIFFLAFNFLEATLPSLISKKAPIESKGTAMGIYSSSQFLGIFFGGLLGGFISEYSIHLVFLGGSILAIIWVLTALRMNFSSNIITHVLRVDTINPENNTVI